MQNKVFLITTALVCLFVFSVSALRAEESSGQEGSSDKDAATISPSDNVSEEKADSTKNPETQVPAVILTRNIFLSKRPRPEQKRTVSQQSTRVVQTYLTLAGIAEEEDSGERVAFIEQNLSGTVYRLKEGDLHGKMTIRKITTANIVVTVDGVDKTVALGESISGTGDTVAASSSASQESEASAISSDVAQSLIEKMKAKRNKQLNNK